MIICNYYAHCLIINKHIPTILFLVEKNSLFVSHVIQSITFCTRAGLRSKVYIMMISQWGTIRGLILHLSHVKIAWLTILVLPESNAMLPLCIIQKAANLLQEFACSKVDAWKEKSEKIDQELCLFAGFTYFIGPNELMSVWITTYLGTFHFHYPPVTWYLTSIITNFVFIPHATYSMIR